MPIDPSIIAGLKPPQFTAPDPLERYGKSLTLQHLMQQGAVSQRAIADDDAVRGAYQQSGGDPATLRALLSQGGQYKAVESLDKAQGERALRDSTIGKNNAQIPEIQQKTITAAVARHRDQLAGVNDPQTAAQWVASGYQDPILAPVLSKVQPLEQAVSTIPTNPQDFQQWKQQHALGAAEYIKQNAPKITTQNLGGTERMVATPGLGGAPTLLNETPRTATPDAVMTDSRVKSEGVANRGVTTRGQNLVNARMQVGVADTGNPEVEKSVQYWADVLRKGGSLPPGLARNRDGAALVKEVMKRVSQGDTTPAEMMASQAEFGGEKAGQRTLGTRAANIEMAVSEALNVIPLALAASEKVNRTNYPTLNSILLAAEKGTGGTDVVQLGVATNSLINVYARAIAPSGVPTVSDKDHAREILANAYSKGQYRAAVGMMEQEMQAAQKSPGQVKKSMREQFTGKASDDPAPQRRASDADSGKWSVVR